MTSAAIDEFLESLTIDDAAMEAARLLIECADELRKHDEDYHCRTDPELKSKLIAFFVKHKPR